MPVSASVSVESRAAGGFGHLCRLAAAVLEARLSQCAGVSSISMEASDIVFPLVGLGRSTTLPFFSKRESTAEIQTIYNNIDINRHIFTVEDI